VPADGNSAATEGNGDFGTSPIFWAALGQATACLYLGKWGAGRKAQYAIENFSAGLSRFDMERLLGRRMAGIDEWIAHGFRSDLECWSSFLVRLFMIQHDCGHGSFFHNRSANDWVGRVIGVLTLTPYDFWRRTHAMHHAGSGHLERRGLGDVDILTSNSEALLVATEDNIVHAVDAV
jgi:hypothetical protein